MKWLTSALISVLLFACTTSTPPASGDKSAAAVTYDNAGSHLVSTTVQDAIDDLAASSSALQDRVDSLARPLIWCDFRSAAFALNDNQMSIAHVFTTSDCGGVLPDAHYLGALSRMTSCSQSVNAITVSNFGEPDGPGVTLRRTATGACSGPAELAAVFYPAN